MVVEDARQRGTKTFHHPVVGRLELAFDAMDLPADPGLTLTLTAYTAEPGSPSEDGLRLLASTRGVPRDDLPPRRRRHGSDGN